MTAVRGCSALVDDERSAARTRSSSARREARLVGSVDWSPRSSFPAELSHRDLLQDVGSALFLLSSLQSLIPCSSSPSAMSSPEPNATPSLPDASLDRQSVFQKLHSFFHADPAEGQTTEEGGGEFHSCRLGSRRLPQSDV